MVKLLVVFAVAFSLASVSGPMSGNFHLPTVPTARAVPQNCTPGYTLGNFCTEFWVPAGAAEDTFVANIFTDETAEFTDIQSGSPSIDFTDWPLTPALTPTFTSSSNFRITAQISAAGNFEIQFMLANNFWGINMNYGNSTQGVEIRQGIWHMIDTNSFATNEPSLSGQAVALDSPNPSDNVGGLPAVNPCNWDKSFIETGSNCVTGAPGGTAYHLASATGADGFVWNQAPGSADLNAAAQHFVNAGIATGFNSGTSVLTGISAAAAAHPVNFFIRNDNPPRLDLGNSLAAQICWIFTGSYTTPCTYLTITRGPVTAFPGFTTSNSTVNLSWGIYTATYSSVRGPLPFDSTFYFTYNSNFVSGISSIKVSGGGLCANSSVPTVSAPDYIYLCDPIYDQQTNSMEFASSLASALSFGQQAEDRFGAHAYTMEVFEQNEQFGYLNNGWIRVDNNIGSGLPNFWTWLNAWNPGTTVSSTVGTGAQPFQGGHGGQIHQAIKQPTTSVSPFIDSTVVWDDWIVGNIYDTLMVTNPVSGGQIVDWMVLSAQQLPNSGLTYTPPSGTTQTFRFTLRSDLFFQDGRKVTSFDVAFSYLALKGTGAFAGGGAAPMTGVTILGPSQFDINVNAVGPFTLLTLTGLPIMPGAYWSNAGSSAWTSAISTCTATNAACYPAQYTVNAPPNQLTTTCTLTCAFPAAEMNVNVGQTDASYDPLANHALVGSGAYECAPVTSSGSSTSCSSTGSMNPPVGGSYVLQRFGKGFAPGSSISGIYFRSNGNLATYLWSLDTGVITSDFLNFSVVASCFGAAVTSTGPCAHFQRGIGANGGPVSVGLAQVAIVNRFVGTNWIAPFSWSSSPPAGIIPLNPVLYENTITLNPASVAGCTTPYPTGGYDC